MAKNQALLAEATHHSHLCCGALLGELKRNLPWVFSGYQDLLNSVFPNLTLRTTGYWYCCIIGTITVSTLRTDTSESLGLQSLSSDSCSIAKWFSNEPWCPRDIWYQQKEKRMGLGLFTPTIHFNKIIFMAICFLN